MGVEELKDAQKRVVGAKQTLKTLEKQPKQVMKLFVAQDAEEHVTNPIEDMARKEKIEIAYVETMMELGKMCGIKVGAAVAALVEK